MSAIMIAALVGLGLVSPVVLLGVVRAVAYVYYVVKDVGAVLSVFALAWVLFIAGVLTLVGVGIAAVVS